MAVGTIALRGAAWTARKAASKVFNSKGLAIGGALAADELIADGAVRGAAWDATEKPREAALGAVDKKLEEAKQEIKQGLEENANSYLDSFMDFAKENFLPLLGAGAGFIFGDGAISKMFWTAAFGAATYFAQQYFFKDDFNQAAAPTETLAPAPTTAIELTTPFTASTQAGPPDPKNIEPGGQWVHQKAAKPQQAPAPQNDGPALNEPE